MIPIYTAQQVSKQIAAGCRRTVIVVVKRHTLANRWW